MQTREKELRQIRSILQRSGTTMGDLSGKEIKTYFDYRIAALIKERAVLTNLELKYLLIETGRGSLRFDNELIDTLLENRTIKEESLRTILDIDRIVELKETLSKQLMDNARSDLTVGIVLQSLEKILGKLEVISKSPLLLKGNVEDVGFVILWKSEGYIGPDNELFNQLQYAKEEKLVPVIIAKKVHGVLFPLFKELGITGFNTYTTLVSDQIGNESKNIINELADTASSMPWNVKISFNGRFEIAESLLEDSESPLYMYLRERMPKAVVSSNFIQNEVKYKRGFDECVKFVKGKKLKAVLTEWSVKRKRQLASLKRLK